MDEAEHVVGQCSVPNAGFFLLENTANTDAKTKTQIFCPRASKVPKLEFQHMPAKKSTPPHAAADARAANNNHNENDNDNNNNSSDLLGRNIRTAKQERFTNIQLLSHAEASRVSYGIPKPLS